jgi:hypothetical protein
MSTMKRGDHVFNNSLKQTLEELSQLVQEVLDVEQRRPSGQGRADHIRRVLGSLREGLNQRAFDLTVTKPTSVPGGDANSRLYGDAKKHLVFGFRQFLTALKNWASVTDQAGRDLYLRQLSTHGKELRLLIGKWTDAAVDPQAEAQLLRESPAEAMNVRSGRTYLEKLRTDLVEVVKYYSP